MRATAPPNILFIAVDDLRPELSCYGASHIHSPNIDQLASEGMLFERTYCQQAVCSPSRISLMTGLRPDSTYIYDIQTHHRSTLPAVVTLPQHFIRHGYHAADFGKIYHGHMGRFNDVLSWSEPWYYPPQHFTENLRGYLSEENLAILRKRKRPGKPNFSANATEGEDVADEDYPDGQTVKKVLTEMPRFKAMSDEGTPFFLAIGFEKPHLPFLAPKKYWDLYDRDSVMLPGFSQLPHNAPEMAGTDWGELRAYYDIPSTGNLSEAKARELVHGYYACVSYVDALIGKLVAGLKQNDLYDNTIIVLWGDHGWKLGDYGDWCKLTNFELDTRVPLLVRVPGNHNQGQSTRALVEFVDIYPSLCELSGIPLPNHLQGDSFVSLLANPDQAGKEAVFSQFPRGATDATRELAWEDKEYMGYSMRTDRYRYTEWLRWKNRELVARELYDHQRDPQETANVIDNPAYRSVRDSLSRAFRKNLANAHRQGSERHP